MGGAITRRTLDPERLGQDEDWEGNNAAFRCPVCQKVFIVSGQLHKDDNGKKGYRKCPNPGCGKSIARITGGRKSGGSASIEWASLNSSSDKN